MEGKHGFVEAWQHEARHFSGCMLPCFKHDPKASWRLNNSREPYHATVRQAVLEHAPGQENTSNDLRRDLRHCCPNFLTAPIGLNYHCLISLVFKLDLYCQEEEENREAWPHWFGPPPISQGGHVSSENFTIQEQLPQGLTCLHVDWDDTENLGKRMFGF